MPFRWIVVIVLASVVIVCTGGLSLVFQIYGKAATVHNGNPVVAVDSLLQAMFFDPNEPDVRTLSCDSKSLVNLRNLQSDLANRERQYNIKITVTWDSLAESAHHGNTATVNGNIIVATTANGEPLRRVLPWRFTVVNKKGWQVCGASGVT